MAQETRPHVGKKPTELTWKKMVSYVECHRHVCSSTLIQNIRLVVHGDDFTFLCSGDQVSWVKTLMSTRYEIKIRGVLGDEKTDDKSIRILNRLLEWRKSGITYEADPRHVEIVLNDLDMKNCASVGTPGVKLKVDPDNDPALDATWSSKYRQITGESNVGTKNQ